ncbi:MAG: Ig-like domain-containing protein [Nitrososphaerales archaeon]
MRSIKKLLKVFILISLIIASFPSIFNNPINLTKAEGFESYKLVLSSLPPKVPADGKTYECIVIQIQSEDGNLIPAPDDVLITLSSSKPSVGIVQKSVIIMKGENYAIANFTSTESTGTTIITASAQGYKTGFVEIETITPTTYPRSLAVYLSPSQILAKESYQGKVIIQLEDVNHQPARAEYDVIVTLSSSLDRVVRVDPKVIIPKGKTFAEARYYVTNIPGEARITASASGYISGSNLLRTFGRVATKLAIYIAPSKLPSSLTGFLSRANVVIQLLDSNGLPTKALKDIEVKLSSSNESVAKLDEKVIWIRRGGSYAITTIQALAIGNASITATSFGHEASIANIEVVEPIYASFGYIKLILAPNSTLTDKENFTKAITVQLVNKTGYPVRATQNVKVHITSSNPNVGIVQSSIVINAGENSGTAWFTSTGMQGDTIITAIAENYESDSSIMRVIGIVPYKLAIYATPPILPADGKTYESLIIELQDYQGRPVEAPIDINIYLSSSRVDVGSVDEIVVIHQGENYAVTKFYSTVLSGSTNITVFASGFLPGWKVISTIEPLPTKLKLYASPNVIPADGKSHKIIAVELRDSLDIAPARARDDIIITLSSTNPNVGIVEPTILLRKGETFTKTFLYVKDIAGETEITAHASGFISSSIKIKTILYPISLQLWMNATKVGLVYQSKRTSILLLNLTAESMGQPIPNASVIWSSNTTGIFNEQKVTDRMGKAFAYFYPPVKGSASITAIVTKVGFTKANITVKLNFLNSPLTIDFIKVAKEIIIESINEVIIRVTSEGKPIEGASLTWVITNGSLTNISNITNVEGKGSAIFSSNIDGNFKITVKAVKDRFLNATASTTIIVKPKPMVLSLQIGRSVMRADEEVEIIAMVTSDGKPVADATISWVASMGILKPSKTITDSNGMSNAVFTPKFDVIKFSSEFATIDVKASKKGYVPTESSLLIEIRPFTIQELLTLPAFWQRIFIPLIAFALICVVGVLIFIYVSKRRAYEKELSEEIG